MSHSFFDVERQDGPGDIAGWAVDFTAVTGDDGGFVYMARGVFGRYPGHFGVRPYYEQLKRYSDWENRNIWEYRLDVRDDGIYVGLEAEPPHATTVTDVMAQTMTNWGVRSVFGIVGHSNLGL